VETGNPAYAPRCFGGLALESETMGTMALTTVAGNRILDIDTYFTFHKNTLD
jgi:hypothetical protein